MSDQYPTSPPPPNQMPTPPAEQYPPQESSAGGSGRKTTLVIVGIVVAVLVICGCSAATGVLAFRSVGTRSGSTLGGVGVPGDDGPRFDEWRAWEPELAGERLAEAPSGKLDLIRESLGIVAPDFEADEVFWIEGYYSADDEWYYADYVVLTARHPSSDDLMAGIEFSIQSDQMVAENVPFEPDDGDTVATIADGTYELLYGYEWAKSIDEDLWMQIGTDWPDAIVMEIYESDATAGAMVAEITNRDAYVIEGQSPRVYVTYEETDGAWGLLEWEYWYPENDASEDTPTGSPI